MPLSGSLHADRADGIMAQLNQSRLVEWKVSTVDPFSLIGLSARKEISWFFPKKSELFLETSRAVWSAGAGGKWEGHKAATKGSE